MRRRALCAAHDGGKAKAVAGLDEVTRAALDAAQAQSVEDQAPVLDNVVDMASGRR